MQSNRDRNSIGQVPLEFIDIMIRLIACSKHFGYNDVACVTLRRHTNIHMIQIKDKCVSNNNHHNHQATQRKQNTSDGRKTRWYHKQSKRKSGKRSDKKYKKTKTHPSDDRHPGQITGKIETLIDRDSTAVNKPWIVGIFCEASVVLDGFNACKKHAIVETKEDGQYVRTSKLTAPFGLH